MHKLYEKVGRKPPEGESLEKLYKDVLSVHGAEPQETERVEIKRPDYSVDLILARAAGKMKVEVSGQNGPDGKPFRTLFEGDVVTRPDPSGKGLELVANPASAPLTMTTEQAQMLREKLNGTWTDEKGNTWEISGGSNSITLTDSYQNGHKVVYNGQYNLGKVTGEHIINDPLDMEGLPEQVSQQVASNFRTPYRIALDVSPNADRMEGTFSAQYVTYGMDYTIESVHDWYDRPLMLTRSVSIVRITGVDPPFATLDAIPTGGAFRVEVIYDKDPGRSEVVVTIQTKGESTVLKEVAKHTDAPKIYRTGPIRVVEPVEP